MKPIGFQDAMWTKTKLLLCVNPALAWGGGSPFAQRQSDPKVTAGNNVCGLTQSYIILQC